MGAQFAAFLASRLPERFLVAPFTRGPTEETAGINNNESTRITNNESTLLELGGAHSGFSAGASPPFGRGLAAAPQSAAQSVLLNFILNFKYFLLNFQKHS